MSNYLIIVSKKSLLKKIETWVNSAMSDISEIAQTRISHDTNLLYIAKNAHHDFNGAQRTLFKGMGVSYREETVFFGEKGRSEFYERYPEADLTKEPVEGCYVNMTWDDHRATVSNDTFAMCSMLYFSEKDIVAISDSLFMLANLRQALNLPRSLNEEVALARSWGNTMAGQLLSEDTLIDQIKYIQVGGQLQIEHSGDLKANVFRRTVSDLFSYPTGASYAETIKESVRRIASLTHTLSAISVNTVRIALSGGTDSRVILACALVSPVVRELTIFNCTNTTPAHKKDYDVVFDLSSKFDFPLGLRDPNIKRRDKDKVANPFSLWLLGNAGLYDFLATSTFSLKPIGIFSFGGFGAEVYKGMYGWRSVSRIGNHIKNPDVRDAFIVQSQKGVSALGVPPNDKTGSEWHYLAFRNAIHAGRSTLSAMTGLRPLMQRELVGLTRSELNPFPTPGKGDRSIVTDMLIAANPELAVCPFEAPEKNMTSDYVEERSKLLGSGLTLGDLSEYRIFGSVDEVANGASKFFYNIADKFCPRMMTHDDIVVTMKEGFNRISSNNIKTAYHAGFLDAENALSDSTLPLNHAKSYPGKLISFLLVDD